MHVVGASEEIVVYVIACCASDWRYLRDVKIQHKYSSFTRLEV